eukprot:TRINITY_DN29267_c0_g1_i1.p1 TRINITY_DN29267_c0_g1~~TRINITY_DN29267_c0_g1_i1.p1  ORF type:complete len:192 (-),score=45.83 TRINITY_DN29267_c0_g1_i1:142-717(-)
MKNNTENMETEGAMDDFGNTLTIVIPEAPGSPERNEDQVSFNKALAARALLGLRIPTPTSPPAESSILPQMLHMSPIVSPTPSNTLLTLALAKAVPRRPRGEKKPIPEDLKDNKYFERRKRNNLAAKKSRDQRKIREDQICQRATMLEKENAVLRAQVGTLRDEAGSLRALLLQRRIARRKDVKNAQLYMN